MRSIALSSNFTGHAAPITHVEFNKSEQLLASSSYDGTVKIWDISSPLEPYVLNTLKHRRLVNASAWHPKEPKILATASADKVVAVWSIENCDSPTLVNVLSRHTDDINSVSWMPDGEHLVCVSEDGRATLWNAFNGRFLREISSHEAHCMMVSINKNGLIATVGEDGLVTVSNSDSSDEALKRRYNCSIEGCSWSNNGAILAIARDDGAVDLLNTQLDLVNTFLVSTSAARCVSWSVDDSQLIVGAYDGALHFFNKNGELIHKYSNPQIWPRSVTTVGNLVSVGSFSDQPYILDLNNYDEISVPKHKTHGPNVLFSYDNILYVGCDSGLVILITLASGENTIKPSYLRLSDSPILSLLVHEGVIYAGTYAGNIIKYDGEIVISEQLGAPVPSLCFDGENLIAGTYNGEFIAIELEKFSIVMNSKSHTGSVKSLARIENENIFISGSTDRTVVGGSFYEREILWEHGNLVNSVATLDKNIVASASRDHTVKVGKIKAENDSSIQVEALRTLIGFNESVKCVALLGTEKETCVIAGSYDFGLYTWQVDWDSNSETLISGSLLEEFNQAVSHMTQIDTNTVAAASWDGRVVIIKNSNDSGPPKIQNSWQIQEILADVEGELILV